MKSELKVVIISTYIKKNENLKNGSKIFTAWKVYFKLFNVKYGRGCAYKKSI